MGDDTGSVGTTTAADTLGLPTTAGEPVPDAEGADAREIYQGVLIMNSIDSPGSINYTLNGHPFTIQPGFKQKLDASQNWTIEFDRGESFGVATYGLSAGTYQFQIADKGWSLFKTRFEVKIDNSGNSNEFNFTVNEKQAVVSGGGVQTHTSDYPPLVGYDRGDGASRSISESVRAARCTLASIPRTMWSSCLLPRSSRTNKRRIAKSRHNRAVEI